MAIGGFAMGATVGYNYIRGEFMDEPFPRFEAATGRCGGPTAVMRAEQLYPFPEADLKGFVDEFPNATEVVWCQEEPQNQGAWYQIRHHLQACISEQHELKYVGRPHSASPAVGYYTVHLEEQLKLVREAILPEAPGDDQE